MGTERRALMKLARRLLASRADAEDAVQDTYVRALAVFPDCMAPRPAWLYTVLRNIAVDRLRRKRLEADDVTEDLASDDGPQTSLELQSQCEAALHHLLRRVSFAEATAMVLRDVFEFDYDDIARIIDKSEGAVRQFLHRARMRARRADPSVEYEEFHVRLFWRAIESRDPAPLMHLLRTTTASAQTSVPSATRRPSARSTSVLLHLNGRYAIAWVLDGIVLCIVPVGATATTHAHATATAEL